MARSTRGRVSNRDGTAPSDARSMIWAKRSLKQREARCHTKATVAERHLSAGEPIAAFHAFELSAMLNPVRERLGNEHEDDDDE